MHPKKESSTKASPGLFMVVELSTELYIIVGIDPKVSIIKQKRRSHRKGPRVEPCPEP